MITSVGDHDLEQRSKGCKKAKYFCGSYLTKFLVSEDEDGVLSRLLNLMNSILISFDPISREITLLRFCQNDNNNSSKTRNKDFVFGLHLDISLPVSFRF